MYDTFIFSELIDRQAAREFLTLFLQEATKIKTIKKKKQKRKTESAKTTDRRTNLLFCELSANFGNWEHSFRLFLKSYLGGWVV